MSAAGPDELDHVLFPAIARLAAGLLERHAQQHPPADATLIWEVADLLASPAGPPSPAVSSLFDSKAAPSTSVSADTSVRDVCQVVSRRDFSG
jgi:hypothetical protein